MPKEIIVPGVHDLIPPQGRVTVRLLDPDRPWRIRKEVKEENAIMNWWLSAANKGYRGGWDNDTVIRQVPGFSPNVANTTSGFVNSSPFVPMGKPGYWPGRYGNYVNKFWASDQDVTPDADKPWIPTNNNTDGALTAFSPTDVITSLDVTKLARGTPVASESWSKWDQARTVMEWGTTQGNGTWRSVGFGEVQHKRIDNEACPGLFYGYQKTPLKRDSRASGVVYDSGSINSFDTPDSMSFESATLLWATRGDGYIASLNPSIWTWITSYISFGTGTGRMGIVGKAPDVWVTRNKNLYRVDPDISSISITNTYDLSSNITESDIIDITTDGTDFYLLSTTHVHKVNTSGVWQSSWAHSLTASAVYYANIRGNIEYDPNMNHLWISMDSVGTTTSAIIPRNWSQYIDSDNDCSFEHDDFRVRSFSLAGTALNYISKPGWNSTYATRGLPTGLTGMDPQGWVSFVADIYAGDVTNGRVYPLGPNAVSHSNLGSDIVKTSSDSLQVIYDFDFS